MATITVTRRGRIVIGICVLAIGMALAAGGRSLNAVVLPGIVALAAGYYQLARVEDPNVRRTPPADGFVGETGEVALAFHGGGGGDPVSPPFPASVSDRLDEGLAGPRCPSRRRSVPSETGREATSRIESATASGACGGSDRSR